MKLVENNIIARFRHEEYFIEICTEKCMGIDAYDAYLQKEGYGIKMSMFGAEMDKVSADEFIALVDSSLDDYIELYEEEGYGT